MKVPCDVTRTNHSDYKHPSTALTSLPLRSHFPICELTLQQHNKCHLKIGNISGTHRLRIEKLKILVTVIGTVNNINFLDILVKQTVSGYEYDLPLLCY